MATQEFVVPRSIPMILAIIIVPFREAMFWAKTPKAFTPDPIRLARIANLQGI
jgi:hypothetical protein